MSNQQSPRNQRNHSAALPHSHAALHQVLSLLNWIEEVICNQLCWCRHPQQYGHRKLIATQPAKLLCAIPHIPSGYADEADIGLCLEKLKRDLDRWEQGFRHRQSISGVLTSPMQSLQSVDLKALFGPSFGRLTHSTAYPRSDLSFLPVLIHALYWLVDAPWSGSGTMSLLGAASSRPVDSMLFLHC